MIFDLIELPELTVTRYKPRNKTSCRGSLYYAGEEIASLRTLVVLQDAQENLIGGRLIIEWHRLTKPTAFTETGLDIHISYDERGVVREWIIRDIALLCEGVILCVQDLTEVLGTELPFFAYRLEPI